METRDVRRAWEDFYRDGMVSPLVRPAVLASWRRSSQHQIAVTQPKTTVVTEADFYRRRQQHRTFLHAARPAMEQARKLLASANSMAILTDPTGTVLETVGDARAMDLGSSVKLQRGGRWGEAEIGTNTIGEMPLEQLSYLLRVLEDGMVYRVGSHEGAQGGRAARLHDQPRLVGGGVGRPVPKRPLLPDRDPAAAGSAIA